MTQFENQDCRASAEPPGWHLDKKVPISLILTVLLLGVSGIWAIADVKKDVELIKADIQVLHQRDDRASTDLRDSLTLLRAQLDKINDKMDRIMEKGLK